MKHLVVGVSPESSLELLREYADIIYLDKKSTIDTLPIYDTVYIRSHFAEPTMLPQNFRSEIDEIVRRAKERNPTVTIIDGMDTVDAIIDFEDKWLQYQTFSKWMPQTELLNPDTDVSSFTRPIFKRRVSSHGQGVTWDIDKTHISEGDWIVQEALTIDEELRIYVISGKVYPVAAIRESMTHEHAARPVGSRKLQQDEAEFSLQVVGKASNLDMVGLDVARTSDGALRLIEVNRSPGFAKFYQLTGINLAGELYK